MKLQFCEKSQTTTGKVTDHQISVSWTEEIKSIIVNKSDAFSALFG